MAPHGRPTGPTVWGAHLLAGVGVREGDDHAGYEAALGVRTRAAVYVRYVARVEQVVNPAWQQLQVRRQAWARACPGSYDICQRAPAYCTHTARQACDVAAARVRPATSRKPQTPQRTRPRPPRFHSLR